MLRGNCHIERELAGYTKAQKLGYNFLYGNNVKEKIISLIELLEKLNS